jgi:uncharacterized protein YkvS
MNQISKEKDYYSDITIELLPGFIILLNQFPGIFEKLNDSAKILTTNTIEKDADLDTYAIFLSKNIKKHIEKILNISWDDGYENNYITTQSILEVFHFAINEEERDLAFDFLIKMFGKSNQFDMADSRFDNLIKPYITDFTKKELKQIVYEINENSQIFDRRRARNTNSLIKERIDEIYETLDLTEYNNFKY